jgi:hypothetical protein
MPPDVAVSDLLLEWEERAAAGCPVTPEELCRSRPELLGELRRCIALLRYVSPLLDLDGTPVGGAVPAIPGFEVLDCLGGGGMVVVYRARDTALERVVAIKMPHLRILAGDLARSRFEREARVLAQLRHPNIVPVHAVSLADGQPYFVMDYIPQGSLAGKAFRLTGQIQVIADIIEKVARAVHYAHERGILHRDLKPSNILLDERGQPLVADFGLAKVGAESWVESLSPPGCADGTSAASGAGIAVTQLTLPGTRPGTPRYMAPEQLRGEPQQVTGRADVWALGVILFELLTGRPPFAATEERDIAAAVCEETPPSPRGLCRGADAWLEGIVLKCLEKDPARRYATAAALADDLARWRRGELPSGVREGRVRGLLRRVRRRPALATAAALLLAFGALAFAFRPQPPQPLTPAEMEQRAEDEYREATAPLVRDLAAGRTVSLVTKTTGSLPCRWRVGQGHIRFNDNPQEDGAVTISAHGPTLLEFFPEIGRAAYHLVVELRHESRMRANEFAEVAVAFACTRGETEEGPQFFFGRVSFADLGSRATAFRDKAGQPASQFRLGFFHLGTSSSGHDRTSSYIPTASDYPPARTEPGPWRHIEIDVQPGELRAKRWDGEAVAVVPDAQWPRALSMFRFRYPDLREIEPRLVTRGAVGLYLEGSVVSLRRFDVEPRGERD